jgi:hypothetical protein
VESSTGALSAPTDDPGAPTAGSATNGRSTVGSGALESLLADAERLLAQARHLSGSDRSGDSSHAREEQ